MKATREELIDLLKFMESNTATSLILSPDYYVDKYLKSINSEAGNETPTVTDNEAKKKKCPYCGSDDVIMFTSDCDICQYCGRLFTAL